MPGRTSSASIVSMTRTRCASSAAAWQGFARVRDSSFTRRTSLIASMAELWQRGNGQREDFNTDGPLSPYAASKKAAEVLCHTYHYLYGLDVAVLRYFTVYGPAGRPDMSLFRFAQWIADDRPVTVYGDGIFDGTASPQGHDPASGGSTRNGDPERSDGVERG